MRRLSNLLILFLLTTGCSCTAPTYPKETVVEAVKEICREEYDLEVKAKLQGQTLGIYAMLDNLIGSDLRLTPEAGERVDNLALSISRVSLSTDADIKFFIVIARDKVMPNAELVMVRYVNDLRRFLRRNISRSDYLERMVLDLHFNPIPRTSPDTDDVYFPDIDFENFLSHQLKKRIEKLTGSKPDGEFLERDGVRYFQFTLAEGQLNEESLKAVLELTVEVLSKYKFDDFDGVVIVDAAGGTRNLLNKNDLIDYGWRTKDETHARWFWRRFIEARQSKQERSGALGGFN